MPPFVPRKRHFSPEPAAAPAQPSPSQEKRRKTDRRRAVSKASVFDAVDTPPGLSTSVSDTKRLLAQLHGSDSESSLSDVDSDDFEDVPPAKKQRTNGTSSRQTTVTKQEEADSEEEEIDWEDAVGDGLTGAIQPVEREIGDISISLDEDGQYVEPVISLATGSKGPSKRERQVRTQTHCLHVLSLMWHNTVRNSWLNDKQVHKILIDGLPEGVKREVRRWREQMGTLSKEELEAKKRAMAAAKAKGKRGRKSKVNASGRDWSYDADHLEQGVPNLSRGDPLLRLLKVLTAYWRKRFLVTAPGLRKQGYMPLKRLRDDIRAWEKNKGDQEAYGERIEDRAAFRKLAEVAEGSKDVGAQLFCALLRGLGIEARMVTNLQPAGLGFNTREEASAKPTKTAVKTEIVAGTDDKNIELTEQRASKKDSSKSNPKLKKETPARKSKRGNKAEPISLDDTDSALSDPPSDVGDDTTENAVVADSDDDLSVIDVTPAIAPRRIAKKYDRDLAFPNYWTEVCSPATHKWIPVDPIVLSTIASNDELLQTFEPRGQKADRAKQVICYTLAYAADGSAKDVTIRYLKRHQLPGKTKGVRMAVEKVPVHNSRGKVKKYEEYDWFRTVMSMYDRPEKLRTAADDLEEQTDLKPFKPAKVEKEVEKESLQGYKQSAEFVLEQHLRREEALLPNAEAVRTFVAGKGDKAVEHLVYRRADVVVCKTTESWHKEGRQVLVGEQPMKMVPVRAVTLIRKREMEEAERETGEKLKQGLYAKDQTDWIIPPPIKNGVIPKNAFGNMDVYVPSMVPEGAVHLPLKGTAKLCRRLEIDHAEACTGFEFGKQRAVPVITGVVVAKEHEKLVRDAWKAEQLEIKRKEDTKRTATSLHWWRKMVMGMRIVERMRAEYAHANGKEDEFNPFVNKANREGRQVATDVEAEDDDVGAGGFFRQGHDEEETAQSRVKNEPEDTGGGFLADSDEAEVEHEGGGGFIVENDSDVEDPHDGQAKRPAAAHRPFSLQSMHNDLLDSPIEKEELECPPYTATERMSVGPKVSATSRKQSAKPTKPKSETEDDLSDLSEADLKPDGAHIQGSRRTIRRQSSPQVVVRRPQKPSPRKQARPSISSSKTKTAQRSKYFVKTEDASDVDMSDDENLESEGEVVAPRRTTARTRSVR